MVPFIECAKWQNIVYARTLKCGSEFFYRNFVQTAGWKPILYEDIDWSKDTVFSYIMDPIKRRHKGLGEFIVANNLQDHLFNSLGFRETIAKVSCLDEHSASLHNIYGEDINKIHWMFLTDDHDVGIKQTEAFLQEHGHPNIQWNKEFTHTTANYLKDIYQEIKSLWESGSVPAYVQNYFKKDIELFQRLHDR